MSTLTKVFVVLVVLVSLVYLGVTATLFAYRVQFKKMYQDEVTAHEATKKVKDDEIEKLKGEKESQRVEIETVRKEADLQKQAAESAQGELADWKSKHTTLLGTFEKLQADYNKLSNQYQQVFEENSQMRKQVDDAQARATSAERDRDEAQQKYSEASSELADVKKNLADIEKQYVDRARDLQVAQEKVRQVQQAGIQIPDIAGASAKPVDGVVQAVSQRMNLLIVSVGKDEGVGVGTELTVYRGDKFVGKLVVEKVDRDWSSARSLEEFEQDHIQVGDKVSTRIGN